MKQRIRKIYLLTKTIKSLRFLKVFIILFPVLLFLLLEILRRYTILAKVPITVWATLSLLLIVIVAALLFSKIILSVFYHLQKENVHRLQELATLIEMHQTLDEFNSLNTLLNSAMDNLIKITAADLGVLYLVDEQSNELVHALNTGILEKEFKKESQFQLKEWLEEASSQAFQQVIIEDLKSFRKKSIASLVDIGLSYLTIVPLKSRNSVIGIVGLFSLNSGHLNPSEANILLNVGGQIAMAVEKVRLYEKVQAIAVVEERERIAEELHDGLAQVLSYVITKSQATRQLLKKMFTANEYLIELENVAQNIYTDTREAILGLKTAIASEGSMVSVLKEYAVRFSQMHEIETELIVGEHFVPSLSPQVELQVIRIVQEALSNVRKHAEATHVMINITAGEDEIKITVQDDGKGFDVNKTQSGEFTKFGLRNMKKRADGFHGDLSIYSIPENGTKVTLSIPLTFSESNIEEVNKDASTDS